MKIDTSSRKEQRNFGLVMAGAITVLGCIRWAIHREGVPLNFLYVAGAFAVVGLVFPRILRPILIVWLKFAEAVNWVMTRVLLTLAFVLMIVPAGLILRLRRQDPLHRAWDPNAPTYWEDPEDQPAEFERYLNQF